mmetsp:Transcript_19318/g.32342  ORF Transcript_19318/g.32342 Transcript_19318/m.32342 type:complete len:635 (-) Transcript_19318:1688-3592(-)|eukprot:CAMPEP_0203757404 /NCGR_PEP_ID=MMETSP0098-20131031/10484_1 /ASSEMBLY_ACC=CAM_ASM_000208 /TAXON_ID=96639 /ORGANISM=" , Strain NY0313808BC1" /LENGTH=634 /DNA_ID=CAMNT_0050649613 /DNA_START=569 /DNA_END=2473 /DNA_ORIENTATION=-
MSGRTTIQEAAEKIRAKNPGKVPIICQRDAARSVPGWFTKREKFLVSDKFNVSQFKKFVRGSLKCLEDGDMKNSKPPRVHLFRRDNQELVDNQLNIAELDQLYRHDDGFLYLTYVATYLHTIESVNLEPSSQEENATIKVGSAKEQTYSGAGADDKNDKQVGNVEAHENRNSEQSSGGKNVDEEYPRDQLEPSAVSANDGDAKHVPLVPTHEDEYRSPKEEAGEANLSAEDDIKKSEESTKVKSSVENDIKASEESTKVKLSVENSAAASEGTPEVKVAATTNTKTSEETIQAELSVEHDTTARENTTEVENKASEVPTEANMLLENVSTRTDTEQDKNDELTETLDVKNSGDVVFPSDSATDTQLEDEGEEMECPATDQDLDELYKSPNYQQRAPFSYNDDHQLNDFAENTSTGAYSRTVSISSRPMERDSIMNSGDCVTAALTGFDSMILSDDSYSNKGDDALSNTSSAGRESTSGWPSLSRESGSEEVAGNHLTGAVLQPDDTPADAQVNEEESGWIEVDSNEMDFECNAYQEERGALEKGREFIYDKISQLELPKVNKELISSKAATLRTMAANMVNRAYDSENSAQFPTRFTYPEPSTVNKNSTDIDEDEDWTAVNFDGKDESFGEHFL